MKNIVNKLHIVIDARLYGPKHTGLGRYTKNLLVALANLPDFDKYKFTLLIYPELEAEIKKDLKDNYQYFVTNIRHYSVVEQLLLPIILKSLNPDLVHFTHLDKPVFYSGASIVTIHDLIRHFSKGPETTTKNPLLYWPKYLGYLLMTKVILMTSQIIVPSNFWRDYIIKKYNFNSRNIITTYEAVDPNISITRNSKLVTDNYLLYVGNLYPHKNIKVIFQAVKLLPDLKLKIICARDVFYDGTKKLVETMGLSKQVEFLGYVPDSEFGRIYSQALALVHPSLMEGFSLTGLEAMSQSCPVIASNTSCMPEIYGDSVLYFDPKNSDELVAQINKLKNDPKLREHLIKHGYAQVTRYSWKKCAQKTIDFYKNILLIRNS